MNNETDKISEERIAVRIDRRSDLYCGVVLVVVGLVAAVFTAIRKNNWLAFAADVVIVALGVFQAVRWFVGRKRPATLISVRGCDLVYFDEKTRHEYNTFDGRQGGGRFVRRPRRQNRFALFCGRKNGGARREERAAGGFKTEGAFAFDGLRKERRGK